LVKIIKEAELANAGLLKKYTIESLDSVHTDTDKNIDKDSNSFGARVDSSKQDEIISKAYQDGLADGAKQAKEEFRGSFDLLSKLTNEFKQKQEGLLKESEEELVRLSISIVKKIIKTEVEQNPEIIKKVAKEAISQLIDKTEVVIKVNPSDLKNIESASAELTAFAGGSSGKIKIAADDFVEQGGCIVQSNSSTVDAEIKTQIEEIEGNLLKS